MFGFLRKFKKKDVLRTIPLWSIPLGKTFKIGGYEFILLHSIHYTPPISASDEGVDVLLKGVYGEPVPFGKDSDFNGSAVDMKCREFAQELGEIIGREKIMLHKREDCMREVSVLSAWDYKNRWKDIIERYPVGKGYWLSNGYDNTSLYVPELGGTISRDSCFAEHYSRPFCRLKRDIMVEYEDGE